MHRLCLSTLLGPTTSALLTPVGLPALTFPFTAATWILVLVAQHQLPSVVTVAVEALSTPEDHRLRLRLSRCYQEVWRKPKPRRCRARVLQPGCVLLKNAMDAVAQQELLNKVTYERWCPETGAGVSSF